MADSNPMKEKFIGGTCMYAYVRVGAGGEVFQWGTGETTLLREEKEWG